MPSSRSPCTTLTRSPSPCRQTFARARATAAQLVSVAQIRAFGARAATATATAPEPVPTSATTAGRSPIRSTTASTSASVVARGVITFPGSASSRSPENGTSATGETAMLTTPLVTGSNQFLPVVVFRVVVVVVAAAVAVTARDRGGHQGAQNDDDRDGKQRDRGTRAGRRPPERDCGEDADALDHLRRHGDALDGLGLGHEPGDACGHGEDVGADQAEQQDDRGIDEECGRSPGEQQRDPRQEHRGEGEPDACGDAFVEVLGRERRMYAGADGAADDQDVPCAITHRTMAPRSSLPEPIHPGLGIRESGVLT